MSILRVTHAEICGPLRLKLAFSDGARGEADLSWLPDRGPVFLPLGDPAYFQQVQLDPVCGTVVWPNGADVAPETLRARLVQTTPVAGELATSAH